MQLTIILLTELNVVVWEYVERIFALIDSLLNPFQQQEWAGEIFKFFKYFAVHFIDRYTADQKLMNQRLHSKVKAYEEEFSEYLYSDSDADSDYFDLDEDEKDLTTMCDKLKEYEAENEMLIQKTQSNGQQSKETKKVKLESGCAITDYLLDKQSKDRFIKNMLVFLKKFIFMEVRQTAQPSTSAGPHCTRHRSSDCAAEQPPPANMQTLYLTHAIGPVVRAAEVLHEHVLL